jgi:NAD(P)H-dependent FMN reductase
MNDRTKTALIYGSTREGRFCDTVAEWAARETRALEKFTVDPIDPAKLDLPTRIQEDETSDQKDVGRRLTEADAFIVVTPEYNHSFPAALKMLIDLYADPWQAKPVGFVSYGGVSGGLRSVEQLRLVFAELHAVTIRDSVSFASAWDLFDDRGKLREPERPRRTLGRMLAQLDWWARTLRAGREAASYGDIAG